MRGILCTGSEKILLSLFVLVSDLWQVLHCSWLPIGVGTYNMRVSSLLTIKRSTELPYYLGIFLEAIFLFPQSVESHYEEINVS